jgi:Asp-tRNA(Asn)/Glu-tRNA(Gln) amidotransferase A subunit family amidase
MRSFLSAAAITPKPLRVRFTVKSPIGDTHPEHADATLAVVKLLEAAGHHVEQGPDFVLVLDDFLPLWQVLIAAAPLLRSKMQPVTRWLVDGAKHVDRRSLGALHDRLARTVDETFGDVDIWVTPAVPVPPPRIGEHGALPPAETFERVAVLGGFTAPFNLTGQPAASIPAGFSRAGLPIGVQIVGRRGEDGLVLALAKQLEQLQPTAARRPPPL